MAVPGNVYVSKRPPRKYPWLRCIRTIICGECGWVPVGKSHKEVNYTRPRKNDSNIFNGIIISYTFIRKVSFHEPLRKTWFFAQVRARNSSHKVIFSHLLTFAIGSSRLHIEQDRSSERENQFVLLMNPPTVLPGGICCLWVAAHAFIISKQKK